MGGGCSQGRARPVGHVSCINCSGVSSPACHAQGAQAQPWGTRGKCCAAGQADLPVWRTQDATAELPAQQQSPLPQSVLATYVPYTPCSCSTAQAHSSSRLCKPQAALPGASLLVDGLSLC